MSLASSEVVILLHGLARSAASMKKMEAALKREGYLTLNCDYPSRVDSVEVLAEETISQALLSCEREYKPTKIHFVTHSMGGILVRYYLSKHNIANLGRVVMLSPPNKGSEIVEKLGHLRVYKWLNGIAGQQIGASADSLPNRLGAVNYEVGVIIGNKSINLLLSLLIDGANDGKVSVARAKVEGMSDFLVMPVCHPVIMRSQKVISQTCAFLKQGQFQR
ncbi:MAG: alpha/beta hydrolase [Methylococcaceae bacterium]|nr:alpha/beta hydrolase [Methylococcaceae bacterium]